MQEYVPSNGLTCVEHVRLIRTDHFFSENALRILQLQARGLSVTEISKEINMKPTAVTVNRDENILVRNDHPAACSETSFLPTSESASRTYDGSALTRPVVTIEGDGFVEDEVSNVRAIGTITAPGRTVNTIAYDTAESFLAGNYSIEKREGTLVVNAASAPSTSPQPDTPAPYIPPYTPDTPLPFTPQTGDGQPAVFAGTKLRRKEAHITKSSA